MNLLAAMVIGRVDEVDNAVMMSSAVFLIAATVIRWALSACTPRGHPRFELIGLATIDQDGAITVVHPIARDECETPAVPTAAERLYDRRTR